MTNPFQYEGGYFESSTGLVKFGTRYYNPNLGRWTQQDPVQGSLGNPDSLNRYLYVTDDPVNLVDASGRDCFIDLVGNLLGGVLAALSFAGYFGALLIAANSGEEIAIAALLFSLTGPSILLAIVAVGGVLVAAYFIAEAITECQGT